MKNLRYIFPMWLLFLPVFVHAEVRISEIMYDVPGSDLGLEWVEVENTGSAVDISKWKFFEANTNHGLIVFQGTTTLQTNSFTIISNNPSKFLSAYPQFSGLLLKSSFSLSNTGESLSLKDQKLNVVNSVTYSSNQGGNGDGGTLQKVSGVWVTGLPTPGVINKESIVPKPVKKTTTKKAVGGTLKAPEEVSVKGDQNALKSAEIPNTAVSSVADVSYLFSKENGKWFIALLALIIVSIVGVFVARKKDKIKVGGIEIVE